MSEYSETVELVARAARESWEIMGGELPLEKVLDAQCESALLITDKLLKEKGHKTYALMYELGDVSYQGAYYSSVAQDILDGDVFQPSVGNVRDYALSLLNG